MKLYTSDLHLDHYKIMEYEKRPFKSIEDMNESIIANWNAKVKKGDDVYIIGDFAFCDGKRANHFLSLLSGNKFLIVGNHDSFLDDKEFDRSKFIWIKQYAEIKDSGKNLILFHYPIAVWDRKQYGSVHLFGHIHSNTAEHHPLAHQEPNSYNVGVDVRDFAPVSLQELIDKEGYVAP